MSLISTQSGFLFLEMVFKREFFKLNDFYDITYIYIVRDSRLFDVFRHSKGTVGVYRLCKRGGECPP